MRPYLVTASIGLAAGVRVQDARALLEAADAAVYEAKRAGRDTVRAPTLLPGGPAAPDRTPAAHAPPGSGGGNTHHPG